MWYCRARDTRAGALMSSSGHNPRSMIDFLQMGLPC
jgi:hypothetical protein